MRSFVLKFRARQALKGRWHTALMVSLIAMLPSLVMQVAVVLTQRNYVEQHAGITVEALLADTQGLMQAFVLPVIVPMLVQLATCFLTLGMLNYLLGILRGTEGSVATVFSRARYFLKAMGLQFAVGLKVVLWLLPLMAMAAALVFLLPDNGEGMSVAAYVLGVGYPIAVSVLVVWLLMRYAMATTLQADEPEKGVFQCIRESVLMMKGRKGRLIMLELSFFGWVLLQSAAQSLLMELAGAVVGSTVGMTLNMFLQVYMQTTLCAFYLDACGEERRETADALQDAENSEE